MLVSLTIPRKAKPPPGEAGIMTPCGRPPRRALTLTPCLPPPADARMGPAQAAFNGWSCHLVTVLSLTSSAGPSTPPPVQPFLSSAIIPQTAWMKAVNLIGMRAASPSSIESISLPAALCSTPPAAVGSGVKGTPMHPNQRWHSC